MAVRRPGDAAPCSAAKTKYRESLRIYPTTYFAVATPYKQNRRAFELVAEPNRENVLEWEHSTPSRNERILTCRAHPRHQDKKREPLRWSRNRLLSGMTPRALPTLPRFLSTPAVEGNIFADGRGATKAMAVSGVNRHDRDIIHHSERNCIQMQRRSTARTFDVKGGSTCTHVRHI